MEAYLYHYYEESKGPFRNLSSLPTEEAKSILAEIKKKGEGFASKRSDDYIDVRKELEQRARTMFIEKGGKPRTLFPHYMSYEACPWLKTWFLHGREIRIPLEEFDSRVISFTYGDLFPTMRFADDKPYRKNVYTKDEIFKLIEQFGLPQEWNQSGEKGPERYIEVQVWDEEVIRKYISIDLSHKKR